MTPTVQSKAEFALFLQKNLDGKLYPQCIDVQPNSPILKNIYSFAIDDN